MTQTKRKWRQRGTKKNGKKRVNLRLDLAHEMVIDAMIKASPIKKTDVQIIKWCILEVGRSRKKKIAEKINEHDTKANWWREQLKLYEEKNE